ncbi:peroxisomal N(1)-acetyl-spermine/spermidine oxidase isoform X2 [Rhincodon typus]|uniref:peroxisomal N(1)-acetyl-spermine/spermidine oxidase isoform X2 n=1 Tax=Rhincodon typus TaxID=259920 RepID=UPI0020305041|nr:peroxisomal N(1)-acetyl-spermine/spermidine oxidase isoform X2 [Rhincodon typus]
MARLITRQEHDSSIVIVGCGLAGLGAAQRLLQHGFSKIRLLEATERCGGRVWSGQFGEISRHLLLPASRGTLPSFRNSTAALRARLTEEGGTLRNLLNGRSPLPSSPTWISDHDGAKGLVEIGAQWIHGPSKQNAVFHLASQYNLLDEEAMSEDNEAVQRNGQPPDVSTYYTSSGKKVGREITAPLEELYSTLRAKSTKFFQSKTQPVHSLGEFLKLEIARCAEAWKGDEEMCNLKLAVLNTEFKMECCISGTDSLDLVALQPFGEYVVLSGIDCVFPGGFASLVDAIRRSLPKDIISYDKPVKCIHWNGSFKAPNTPDYSYSVLVECEDGETIPADHVIVTVPLGFLKEHYKTFIHPPFPPSKIDSIQKLGFGTNNKIFLEFEEPFWEPESQLVRLVWEDESPLFSTRPDLQKEWFRKILGFIILRPVERYGHVILAVLAGEEANYMESLSDCEVKNCLTQIIRKFTGNPLIPPPKGIIRSRWYNDQYTRGSYSYTAVGSSGDDIDVIAQPLPFTSTQGQCGFSI